MAVIAPEKVINREDKRRLIDTFGEVKIDLHIPAKRYGNEIDIGHKVEGSNALFAEGSGGGFGFEGGPL